MRILITTPVFPPDLGGPAIYASNAARWLVERGHEVTVVAFCADPDPAGWPFRVVAIPRGFLPLRYLRAFAAVLREAGRADVVYVQEHLALLHVLAARLRRRPVVVRIMVDGAWEIAWRKGWIGGDDIVTFEGKRYGLRVALARRLQKLWWGWCERIVACSEFLRGIAVERYGEPPDKVVRIYNAFHGVPEAGLRLSREEARAELGLPAERRLLLTICRLVRWKGADGPIRVLADLPGDVDLLIAGEGPEERRWRALARERGVADRVRFLGNVPHDRIPALIRAADVFVLNTEYEGLSHTLLEVLSVGTPIVCTGVCGNPELVEDGANGLLVPPRDDAALAAALRRLLEDPELGRRFAEAGRRRLGAFTKDATFGRVEEVLGEAAGPSARPATGAA